MLCTVTFYMYMYGFCSLLKISYWLWGAIVAMIIWYLDLQLPMQSVPITTDVVNLNLDKGEVYNIMW
jgi:hypothetical protein